MEQSWSQSGMMRPSTCGMSEAESAYKGGPTMVDLDQVMLLQIVKSASLRLGKFEIIARTTCVYADIFTAIYQLTVRYREFVRCKPSFRNRTIRFSGSQAVEDYNEPYDECYVHPLQSLI